MGTNTDFRLVNVVYLLAIFAEASDHGLSVPPFR
jgi:hypothetical protein